MSPASRASHGNEILTGMGKNRERVRFSPRPGHRDRPREAAIHCGRTYHAVRRDGFQDYYAVKSHLAVARRLVAGCGNTCAAMWRGDAARRGTLWGGTAKDAERSPALTPSAEGGERPSCAGSVLPCLLREGRACRGRAHVGLVRTPRAEGGAGTSRADTPRINPARRNCSEVKARGVMREGRACRGRTRAGFVRTPRAEFPPSSCVRFQCVIKSRPWPEPSSPKAPSPRQSNSVGRKVRKVLAAKFAKPLGPLRHLLQKYHVSLPNRSIDELAV